MISVHYIDYLIKTRTKQQGILGTTVIDLKDYIWKKNFKDPFTNRKGGYIKIQKVNEVNIIDAYFFI